MIIRQFPDILWHFEGCPPPSPPWPTHDGGDFTPWTEFCWGGLMGGDFRQVGGDFLAKALDPEGPPQHRKPCAYTLINYYDITLVYFIRGDTQIQKPKKVRNYF